MEEGKSNNLEQESHQEAGQNSEDPVILGERRGGMKNVDKSKKSLFDEGRQEGLAMDKLACASWSTTISSKGALRLGNGSPS